MIDLSPSTYFFEYIRFSWHFGIHWGSNFHTSSLTIHIGIILRKKKRAFTFAARTRWTTDVCTNINIYILRNRIKVLIILLLRALSTFARIKNKEEPKLTVKRLIRYFSFHYKENLAQLFLHSSFNSFVKDLAQQFPSTFMHWFIFLDRKC